MSTQGCELPGRREGKEGPPVEAPNPAWGTSEEQAGPIAPEEQKPPKKRGRKPKAKEEEEEAPSKQAKTPKGKGTKRGAVDDENPKGKVAKGQEVAPKAQAKGKAKKASKQEDEEECEEVAPKAKAKGKAKKGSKQEDDEEKEPEEDPKKIRSRKSMAYVKAKKAALKQGCSVEEATKKAKEVLWQFRGAS